MLADGKREGVDRGRGGRALPEEALPLKTSIELATQPPSKRALGGAASASGRTPWDDAGPGLDGPPTLEAIVEEAPGGDAAEHEQLIQVTASLACPQP
jgi:hypothetical protein